MNVSLEGTVMNVSTCLLYPNTAKTSTINIYSSKETCNTSNLAPSAFYSQIPTDQILALAQVRRLKRHDAMLLLALFSHKRQAGVSEVRPSQARLAELQGTCIRTVQRGLERLEAAGLIVKRYRRDARGRVRGLRYDLAGTLALLPLTKATKMSPGQGKPMANPQAPIPSQNDADATTSPKRQKCRPELESDSDVVEINNSAPASPIPPPSPAVEKLSQIGMLRRVAVHLAAQAGEARCLEALAALNQRRHIKNKPAWLFRCLSESWVLTPSPAPRPPCRRLYSPPPRSAPPAAADPLDAVPASRLAGLEAQARAQLIAELPVLRPVLEKGRRTPQIRGRMRALLVGLEGGGGSGGPQGAVRNDAPRSRFPDC